MRKKTVCEIAAEIKMRNKMNAKRSKSMASRGASLLPSTSY